MDKRDYGDYEPIKYLGSNLNIFNNSNRKKILKTFFDSVEVGVTVDALFSDISSNLTGLHFFNEGLYVGSINRAIILDLNLFSQLAGPKKNMIF